MSGWMLGGFADPIIHDPLTFLGLPRAASSPNWIASKIGCAWAAFARGDAGDEAEHGPRGAATAMLLWLRSSAS